MKEKLFLAEKCLVEKVDLFLQCIEIYYIETVNKILRN